MPEETIQLQEIVFRVRPDAWLPVDQLLAMFHPHNSQTRNERELGAIQASLVAEGFTAENIIINPWNSKIVSGHGRVQACWNLGYRGELPVVYREYPSEEEHRLAMLRWNKARGHQDPAQESAEMQALAAGYTREVLGVALTYSDKQLDALLAEPTSRAEDPATHPASDDDPDLAPVIKVQVAPETLRRYKGLLVLAAGDSEGAKLGMILQCVNPANFPEFTTTAREFTGSLGDDDLWDGEIDADG